MKPISRRYKFTSRGVILIMLLPFVMMIFCLAVLVVDVGKMTSAADKTQLLVDQILLSILNVRADSLQEFADQQKSIRDLTTAADASGVHVPRTQWNLLSQLVSKEKSALSGYKGRLTSIITIMMQANDRPREDLIIGTDNALKMNVQPQSQWVIDEIGRKQMVSALWYQRQWKLDSATDLTNESSTIEIQTPVSWLGKFVLGSSENWRLRRQSQATLQWDALNGDGGYPAEWSQAVEAGKFDPYRGPFFRSQLLPRQRS